MPKKIKIIIIILSSVVSLTIILFKFTNFSEHYEILAFILILAAYVAFNIVTTLLSENKNLLFPKKNTVERENIVKKPKEFHRIMSLQLIKDLDPSLDIEKFKYYICDIFVKVETARMENDRETLKKYLTESYYNTITQELDNECEKEFLSDIKIHSFYISDITYNSKIEIIKSVILVDAVGYHLGINKKVQETFEIKSRYCLYFEKDLNNNESNWLLSRRDKI